MSAPLTVRCALYTRKSTEEGLEQAFNSLDAQREACEAYVKSQTGEGWIALAARYDDGGYSGGNMDRPALKALLADIDRGLIDVVVVYKVDRLTRALADFAKIVERFDNRKVSFVSVTQAFNTTTSMGRLTLNVLLSFAQFEREVTSERIRDKLAASRRKGMWMGGRPPFGYAVLDKKLIVHPAEAPILHRMFTRYLELPGVEALRHELAAGGTVSKAWVSRHGHANGGVPFERGALYHLLQNRLYVGEICHKDEIYPGQHTGLVPRQIFEAVQLKLAEARRRQPGKPAASIRHLLTGLLFDDAGNRMSPTYGLKGGVRYRYYVSQAKLAGKTAPGSVARIPAGEIEDLVLDRIGRLLARSTIRSSHDDPPAKDASAILPDLRAVVDRIVLGPDSIQFHLRREQLLVAANDRRDAASGMAQAVTTATMRERLADGDTLDERDGDLRLIVQGGPIRRGGRWGIETPSGASVSTKPRHDKALLKAIARAHICLDAMLSGEASEIRTIAKQSGLPVSYIHRLLPLAFLAPHQVKAILDGRQSPSLTVDTLTRTAPTSVWPKPGRAEGAWAE